MLRIPTIDISRKTEWQTVVDREKNVYLGHPTTALLGDGKTIAVVYPKSHGYGPIVLKKSVDGARTWSARLPVPSSFATSMEVPTLYRLCDKQGNWRLVLFSGLYPIRMSVSLDEGESWSPLTPIGDFGGVVAMADVIETAPGEYLALFHDDGRFFHGGTAEKTEVYATGEGTGLRTKYLHRYSEDGGKSWSEPQAHFLKTKEQPEDEWRKIYEMDSGKCDPAGTFCVYAVKSTDGGLTWGSPTCIASSGELKLCEPCFVRSPENPAHLVVLLRENSHKTTSYWIESTDNGVSWSLPHPLPPELTGDRHQARYLPDGRLFVSFRDVAKESDTWGDWVAWVGTFRDIVTGAPGEYRIRIKQNFWRGDCAYPGIEILPDGTIVTTTYGHFTDLKEGEGLEDAYVLSVRFKIEEAEALAGSPEG